MSDSPNTDNCTAVSDLCRVEYFIYGYRPNLGANAFLTAIFALFAIAHLGLGLKGKTYFFAGVMVLGSIGEALGYAGRIMLWNNVWDNIGFSIQISCLIFSPAFYAAGIYLTLKHLVLNFGESYSRIPAYLYTWIFISCDFISLLLQAIGGGLASSANDDEKLLDLGTNLMIAGIVFQVAVLLAFASLVIDYTLRVRRNWASVSDVGKTLAADKGFRRFACALVVAFSGVFIRSVYRIAEMAEGWAKPLMRDEASFMVLEGGMIVISVLALTIFHPGRHFPQMSNQKKQKTVVDGESAESGLENEFKRASV